MAFLPAVSVVPPPRPAQPARGGRYLAVHLCDALVHDGAVFADPNAGAAAALG
eukprot:CAMPEP_0198565644 /NCGR_PEP_ID=MMETSP1462-20131121/102095_1 /TAXON_ID=1333877 /ORGANISM="Brandtodinium nutriculum, Strain RCC3387" /LENGTH=52 /DNA_ID=CAMNT_0044296645 /DNA_START=82 /DNA_END=237 /DNA_ORIENTATION=+